MPALPKDMVAIAIKTGASTRAQVTTAPRFKAGDKVVARNINPPTHTRLPRYNARLCPSSWKPTEPHTSFGV